MPKEMTAGEFRPAHIGKQILIYNAKDEPYTTGILAAYQHKKKVRVSYPRKFWPVKEDLTYIIVQGRFEPYIVLSSLRVLIFDKS